MIGAMIIGSVVYILLELAFVGSLNPPAAAHGWANLSFTNQFGPFAALARASGSAGWRFCSMWTRSCLRPGPVLIYAGSSARVSYALGRNGYIPKTFSDLDRRGVPWVSIIFAFAVGMIVFLRSPAGRSWSPSSPRRR